ncbi:MAG: hypothetical protein AVDCRST_MAG87-443 [uncultured Thermomicrobiales bacterium]|uniref:DUF1468 domain-containing protein n=1 Tax=uncultured Thermomicrobiales bacterium TaxID=1645740 RepID=A0A6J4UDR7_9BACT|nr:MAG: hypothetical protein AVDCRST_MAG87-443 [uncultured Thermomicrobiales bacterium]
MTSADKSSSATRWSRIAELLLALGVVALGIIVLVQTQDIRVTRAAARIGPRVIPTIVGGGLVLIGVWYAISALWAPATQSEAESEDVDPTLPADWATIGGIGVALVVYMLTIERLGFIIASALLFVITAFSMGSRSYLRDVAVAILIAVGVYVAFSSGLGVRLPEGVLDGRF